jgi:hypothetical protein
MIKARHANLAHLAAWCRSSSPPRTTRRWMTQLGSGVEKRVGAMMSAEEAEEDDHVK